MWLWLLMGFLICSICVVALIVNAKSDEEQNYEKKNYKEKKTPISKNSYYGGGIGEIHGFSGYDDCGSDGGDCGGDCGGGD